MNRKILVLSIPIVLALLFLGGWFVFRQYERVSEGENLPKGMETLSENPENTTPPVSKIDTSNWKTYRNEKYGFEIRYPDNIYGVSSNGSGPVVALEAKNDEFRRLFGDIYITIATLRSYTSQNGKTYHERMTWNDAFGETIVLNKMNVDNSLGERNSYFSLNGKDAFTTCHAFLYTDQMSYIIDQIVYSDDSLEYSSEARLTCKEISLQFKPL